MVGLVHLLVVLVLVECVHHPLVALLALSLQFVRAPVQRTRERLVLTSARVLSAPLRDAHVLERLGLLLGDERVLGVEDGARLVEVASRSRFL